MTRDEAAYKIAHAFYDSGSGQWDAVKSKAEKVVNDLVALGRLKLDEPKSRDDKVQDAMKASLGIMATWQDLHRIDSAMAAEGLKIVEK